MRYICIILLAIILKTIFFISILKYDPTLKVPQLDSAYYLELSSNLKEGKFVPKPEGFFLLPPGYSYFLALLPYKMGNFINIYIVQIILGVFAVFFIQKLGEKFYGKRAGIFSAILLIFYGPSTFYEARLLSESIIVLFILLFFLLFTSEKKFFNWLSGLILGYLYILRQNILLFIIFLFIWLIWKDKRKLVSLILVIPFLFIVPVINFLGTGKFFGTSAQAGIAFYMGNNPLSYGLFSDPIGLRGNLHEMAREIRIYTEREKGKNLSPFEINLYWVKKVFIWAKNYPENFFKNLILKIQRFLDNWEYGLNEQWVWGEPKITYLFPLPFALIVSAGLTGLFLSIKSKENFTFFLFFISQLLVLLLFFPSSRHRFPLVPVLCLWSGVFLDRFFSLERRKKIFLSISFLLILFFSIIGVPDERRKPDPFIIYNQSIASLSLGDLKGAKYWIEKAIEENWAVPFFHLAKANILELEGKKEKAIIEKWFSFYLGASEKNLINDLGKWSLEKGKFKAAERVFRRSVEIYPKSGAAAINLAQVLYLQGKIEEARKWYEKGVLLGGYPIKTLEEKLNLKKQNEN